MGIHQCPLIVRSCKWLGIISFIHTLQDVLGYLGTHWHQWWVCLALVNDIHQWMVIQWILFMLDIDTFIHMTRIVPSGFAAGEDYTLFHDSSAVTAAWLSPHETTAVPLSLFHDSFSNSSASSTSHFLIQQTSVTATAVVNFHMILQQWHLPWYNSSSQKISAIQRSLRCITNDLLR